MTELHALGITIGSAAACADRTQADGVAPADIRARDEFDLPTMRYASANALGDKAFHPFDPATEHRLMILRESCRIAKAILSGNTEMTVCVPLDVVSDRMRLVRDELEELLRVGGRGEGVGAGGGGALGGLGG